MVEESTAAIDESTADIDDSTAVVDDSTAVIEDRRAEPGAQGVVVDSWMEQLAVETGSLTGAGLGPPNPEQLGRIWQ